MQLMQFGILAIFLFAQANLIAQTVAPSEEAANPNTQNGFSDILISLEKSASEFQPITPSQIDTARKTARSASSELEAFLRKGGPAVEDGWKEFLGWKDLQEQLATPTPDGEILARIATQFYSGHRGLERPKFVRMRNAIVRLHRLIRTQDQRNADELYASQIKGLQAAFSTFAAAIDPVTVAEVNTRLSILESMGQASELANDIRNRFQSPNLVASIDRSLVEKALNDKVQETSPVNEMILSTHVRGTAQTTGNLSAFVVPNAQSARIEVRLKGVSNSRTTGYQSPVKIFSTGRTSVAATVPITLSPSGIGARPATACCVTKTAIQSICSLKQGIGSRLIEKIAWKRARQSKSLAERIASRRAERRVAQMMDRRTRDTISKANQDFDAKVRNPLSYRDLFPHDVKVWSTNSDIQLQAVQGTTEQLASSTAPPTIPSGLMQVQIHESLVTNSAINYFAGLTLTDEMAAELAKDVTGEVPESLELREDVNPWSITFDRQNPFVMNFENNEVQFIIRGRKFTRDADSINRLMEISARYALSVEDGRAVLVRQGEVEVTYPNRRGRRLGTREITYRTFVRNKFGSLFKPEFKSDGIKIPDNLSKIGEFNLNYMTTDAGWLSLGWN